MSRGIWRIGNLHFIVREHPVPGESQYCCTDVLLYCCVVLIISKL